MNMPSRKQTTAISPKIIKSSGTAGVSSPEVWIPENNQVPTVECEMEDGVVRTITVRCGCGCVTNLVCETE